MVRKIALEEHFLSPGFEDYWRPTVSNVDAEGREQLAGALDRIRGDAPCSHGPGGHRAIRAVHRRAGRAERARRRDGAPRAPASRTIFWRAKSASGPTATSGFAHLPMQDPLAAAAELERCMRELKFCGAMINGHTNGQYLDHPSLYPFWERAQALAAPIYIHPTDPVAPFPVLEGYDGLRRATWEWGFETGSHALRLIFGGLFDRFPRAKLMLGHLGETLPFLLWRFDSRAKLYGVKLAKQPSDYIKQNIVVTTSGMCSAEPLNCTIAALGHERVMFAADYPFESAQEAGEFLDHAPLPEPVRQHIAFDNAAKYLGLKPSS